MNLGYRMRATMAKAGLRLLKASGHFDGYWNYWRGRFFDQAEDEGLHILPVHYYSPIPTRADRRRTPVPNSMAGIALDIDAAVARANALIGEHIEGVRRLVLGHGAGESYYDPKNDAFHPLDAALLYATIMSNRSGRIIEIGSGHSSRVICQAARDLAAMGRTIDVTCIEPFLPAYLRPAPAEITTIVESPVQEVPLERFTALGEGDILFIDSTHVVRYGSDVLYEILEILPRLAPGVIVHVHDIFLPADYPDAWLDEHRFFWAEQYMLQAFLSMNPNFAIELPAAAIRPWLSAEVRTIVEGSGLEIPSGSFWIRRL